jgi:hypothetical protein
MDAHVAFIRDAVDRSGSSVRRPIARLEHTMQKHSELFRSRVTGLEIDCRRWATTRFQK